MSETPIEKAASDLLDGMPMVDNPEAEHERLSDVARAVFESIDVEALAAAILTVDDVTIWAPGIVGRLTHRSAAVIAEAVKAHLTGGAR